MLVLSLSYISHGEKYQLQKRKGVPMLNMIHLEHNRVLSLLSAAYAVRATVGRAEITSNNCFYVACWMTMFCMQVVLHVLLGFGTKFLLNYSQYIT